MGEMMLCDSEYMKQTNVSRKYTEVIVWERISDNSRRSIFVKKVNIPSHQSIWTMVMFDLRVRWAQRRATKLVQRRVAHDEWCEKVNARRAGE